MNNLVSQLRKQYPVFEYLSYEWKIVNTELHISWKMKVGDLKYQPELTISLPEIVNQDLHLLDNLVFNLGMAEIPSYWKATCSPSILIKAGSLNSSQLAWWHDLYIKGMGEYFYLNQIDFTDDDFLSLNCQNSFNTKSSSTVKLILNSKPLVLASEGKDTAVTLSLLTQHTDLDTFTLTRQDRYINRLFPSFTTSHQIIGKRTIDSTLLNLDPQKYLNGHIPFSAYLAFSGLLIAYLNGNNKVIVSNEASADEGNMIYLGHEINHQYSKSLEFELQFQSYLTTHLNLGINYFSFLRPLYELQITGILSRYPDLLSKFLSCNQATVDQSDDWCGQCSKCLSTYLMLLSFIGLDQTISLFGHDLLDDSKMLDIYRSLLGVSTSKPFECVSTYQEIIIASNLALNHYDNLPVLLEYFHNQSLVGNQDKLLSYFGPHAMPDEYLNILKQALPVKVK